jgi:hypothetical protein
MLRIEHLTKNDYFVGQHSSRGALLLCAASGASTEWRLYWSLGPESVTEDPSLQHVSDAGVHLVFQRGKCKGAIYTATLVAGEEYRFPYRGQEHFLFTIRGTLRITERNAAQDILLTERQTCRFSRDANEPLLDIRAVGEASTNQVAWVVLHTDVEG